MPRGDGTGPMGRGPLTGKGFGICNLGNAIKNGVGTGLGRVRGFGKGAGFVQSNSRTQKEILAEEKRNLEERLNLIKDQLGRL